MTTTRPDGAEFGTDIDKKLQEWGQLMEREAVPDRLRTLATRLQEALIAARSKDYRPSEH